LQLRGEEVWTNQEGSDIANCLDARRRVEQVSKQNNTLRGWREKKGKTSGFAVWFPFFGS